MTVIGIAGAGLAAAGARLLISASNTAGLGGVAAVPGVEAAEPAPAHLPIRPIQGGQLAYPRDEAAHGVVDRALALASFKANLAVIRTADEMVGALLDRRI